MLNGIYKSTDYSILLQHTQITYKMWNGYRNIKKKKINEGNERWGCFIDKRIRNNLIFVKKNLRIIIMMIIVSSI